MTQIDLIRLFSNAINVCDKIHPRIVEIPTKHMGIVTRQIFIEIVSRIPASAVARFTARWMSHHSISFLITAYEQHKWGDSFYRRIFPHNELFDEFPFVFDEFFMRVFKDYGRNVFDNNPNLSPAVVQFLYSRGCRYFHWTLIDKAKYPNMTIRHVNVESVDAMNYPLTAKNITSLRLEKRIVDRRKNAEMADRIRASLPTSALDYYLAYAALC